MTHQTPLLAVHLIPTAAVDAWKALCDAIASASDAVPCTGVASSLWTSESPRDREAAADRCAGCPVITACDAYATAARETTGVYAGTDRTTRGRTR